MFLEDMIKGTTLAIMAIVVALGLLGVVVMESTIIPQQQQQAFAAGCERGFGASQAFNAS
jgi:hypothetical protein